LRGMSLRDWGEAGWPRSALPSRRRPESIGQLTVGVATSALIQPGQPRGHCRRRSPDPAPPVSSGCGAKLPGQRREGWSLLSGVGGRALSSNCAGTAATDFMAFEVRWALGVDALSGGRSTRQQVRAALRPIFCCINNRIRGRVAADAAEFLPTNPPSLLIERTFQGGMNFAT
jgi:hypothetical protein